MIDHKYNFQIISVMSTIFVAVSIVGMTISTLEILQYQVGRMGHGLGRLIELTLLSAIYLNFDNDNSQR